MLHAINRPVKRSLILAALVTSWIFSMPWPMQCATLERLSLDDMITRSTTIVRGKVTGSWAAYTGSVIYTHYRISVSESFKGEAGATVEVMTPGGAVKNARQTFSGSPLLNEGDEFVFFLWTGKGGITWITGLTQGLFAISNSATGERMASRSASRELMLDAVTSRPVKDGALTMGLSALRARIAATMAAQGAVKTGGVK